MIRSATLLGIILLYTLSATGQQKWENQVPLKHCSIKITANHLMATTYMEWEFYNPGNSEIEGVRNFSLDDGQVVTAFQLDLNGRFRDGTIEEKWKATNSYNAIVGKRIDPALLTMNYQNNYSLRIYPIPAKGSRRVSLTVQQLLKTENNRSVYRFPLSSVVPIGSLDLHIDAESLVIPNTEKGILQGKVFTKSAAVYELDLNVKNSQYTEISFSMSHDENIFCKTGNGQYGFAFRKDFSEFMLPETAPVSLHVFWDVSAGMAERNIEKEISFLYNYLYRYRIKELFVTQFNTKVLNTKSYNLNAIASNKWQDDLRNSAYDGATQLGVISPDQAKDAVNMVFSDGINSYGNASPETNGARIYCISSAINVNITSLKSICGNGGGSVIDLVKMKLPEAVYAAGKTENWIMDIIPNQGKLSLNRELPLQMTDQMVFSGTNVGYFDTLYIHIGTSNNIRRIEKIKMPASINCSFLPVHRYGMLSAASEKMRTLGWNEMIDYGLKEKIITPNTAYIVLERLEDYVRYNIEAPADLREACEKMNYVKRDTRFERHKLVSFSEQSMFLSVAIEYNRMVSRFNAASPQIDLEKLKPAYRLPVMKNEANEPSEQQQVVKSPSVNKEAVMPARQNSLQEVVVTTAFGIKRQARSATSSVQYISAEQLNVIRQTNINNALAGKVAGVQVRSQSAAALGRETFIRLRGENGLSAGKGPIYVLDGTIIDNVSDINLDDIEFVNILQGPASAALFGSDGANGAVVLSSKRGRNYYYNNSVSQKKPYVLKDQEDVDYMVIMKKANRNDWLNVFNDLKSGYEGEIGFYFDMAQFFFEKGEQNVAYKLLMNAAEYGKGIPASQELVAAYLENWRYFEEAGSIYSNLIKNNSLQLKYYKDLAWVNYQQGKIQQAVELLFGAIRINTGEMEMYNQQFKALLLKDLNTIISVHRAELNLASIPEALLCNISGDINLSVDIGGGGYAESGIKEPGQKVTSFHDYTGRTRGLLLNDASYYYSNFWEYSINAALHGNYKISLAYSPYFIKSAVPSFVKIRKFKNFGKPGMSIDTESVIIENQSGEFEVSEIQW